MKNQYYIGEDWSGMHISCFYLATNDKSNCCCYYHILFGFYSASLCAERLLPSHAMASGSAARSDSAEMSEAVAEPTPPSTWTGHATENGRAPGKKHGDFWLGFGVSGWIGISS